MSNPRALIVDDEPDILDLVSITLSRMDITCDTAETLDAARQLASQNDYDFCLTDMRLPDGDGLELVEYIQSQANPMPVAVITAHGNTEAAVKALKCGAFDFVSKPVELSTLRDLVNAALRVNTRKPSPAASDDSLKKLVGNSLAMQAVKTKIHKLARGQAPVLISGESGTGKEVVARMIHETGPRSDAPFIPVNCGAIPSELMESEFFGHKKGSFTGAHADKKGLFEAAQGGTLFLDEVADLPMHMQVKLLRAIQEKAIKPIGAAAEQHVDIRILSASHKDLGALVNAGQFRQDLYYRINVIELSLPPLRERNEDIEPLAEHILDKLCRSYGEEQLRLSAAALGVLSHYSFPGNIRELENILERAIAMSEEGVIYAEDLGITFNTPDSTLSSPAGGDVKLPAPGAGQHLVDMEADAIRQALGETHWNRTAAAKKLGLTLRQLRYRLKKYGIE